MSGTGVLPKHMLLEMRGTCIQDVDAQLFNPASVDMPLSDEAYRLETIFLPEKRKSVRELFTDIGATKHDLSNPLEVGVPYLIRIDGTWSMHDST